MNVAEHILKRISEVSVFTDPFPYFYVERVFPEDAYQEILSRVPVDVPGAKLPTRRIVAFDAGLDSKEFMEGIVGAFNLPHGPIKADTRLVMDRERYGIGPHTDQPSKLLSLLFYLPEDNVQQDIGTSIFAPIDPEFRCSGGQHYKFNKFTKLWTAPFRRNSLFGFWKTDKGFHGVEKIRRPVVRNVLLYNVYHA